VQSFPQRNDSLSQSICAESVIYRRIRMEIRMRDILPDLRERLAAAIEDQAKIAAEFERERKALEQRYRRRLDALGSERAALEQLLAAESERQGIAVPTLAQKLATLVPLGDFFVAKLRAHGPMEKAQLRAEAKLAGYFTAGDGRTFHFTLMNIKNGGRVVQLPDGRYACPDRKPATLEQPEEADVQTLM
jgi:hypothetical protein